ncbi:MAG: WGR domain-containing protein [Proteobacteria bacterium]|nr:WGR domain-containing protein [Pseudomonadota bacterium]
MSIYLVKKNRKANQFWEISVEENTITVRSGETGTNGDKNEQTLADRDTAINEALALVRNQRGLRFSEPKVPTSKRRPYSSRKKVWKIDARSMRGLCEFQFDKAKTRELKKDPAFCKILTALKNIEDTDGILYLNDTMDINQVGALLSHKNAILIKEIRLRSWEAIDLDKIKLQCSQRIRQFKRVFPIDIPDFFFQFDEYHYCMHCLIENGEGFYAKDIKGFESLGCGIFKSVFYSNNKVTENDILSLRYNINELNYFPIFMYGSDTVTHGLVFDYTYNSFLPTLGYNDLGIHLHDGIWNTLSEYVNHLLRMGDFAYYEDIATGFDDFNAEWEREDLFYAESYFYALATIGFLNFHQMPSIKLTDKFYSPKPADTFISNFTITPAFEITVSDHFNPVFTAELVESFLEVFSSNAENIGPTVFKILGLGNLKDWNPQSEFLPNNNTFLDSLESFCVDEMNANRPYIAFLVGLYAWESCHRKTTTLAARLLAEVPDDICHPLIKTAVKLHSKTRFDAQIST